jgi:hypothetical protein
MMCKYIDEQNLRFFLPIQSIPFQSNTVVSGDQRAISRSSVDSPSSSPLAPSPVLEEEGDWLNRQWIGSPLYIVSYIVGLGLGFPVACLRWSPFLLLLWSVVGGCSGAPYFGGGPWRISSELVGSRFLVSDLDLIGFFYYPSLVSVGAGIGDVRFSGRKLGRYVYQLEKWVGLYLPPFLMVCIPFWETRCPASQGCWWRRQIPYSPAM